MRRRQGIHSVLIGGSAVLALSAVHSEEAPPAPDTSSWECKRCPFENGYRAEATAGSLYVNNDSAKFGAATGLDDQGGYIIADAAGRYVNQAEGGVLEYSLADLGLETRSASIATRLPGSYAASLSYVELPHGIFDTTSTPFTGVRGSQLQLPADWVRSGNTAGMSALATGLAGVDIGSKRETLSFASDYVVSRQVDLAIDYSRQQRSGVTLQGAAFGTTATQLPLELDSITEQLDLALRYRTEHGHIALAYYGSYFDDTEHGLAWSNPFTPWVAGADTGQLAAPPDNTYHQLRLSGSYRLPMKTLVSLSGSAGRMRQDEAFLPVTVNSQIQAVATARPSLDGEVSTTNLQVTATSQPLARTRVKAAYRYDDRDDETSQGTWNIVESDSFLAGSAVNVPYDFTRERLALSGEYRLLQSLRVSAGYDRAQVDRNQEVARQVDHTGWGQVQWQPMSFLDVTARAGGSNRDIGTYGITAGVAGGQNPLLRKYHLADRDRQFGELSAAVALPQAPVSFGVTFMAANDNYRRSVLGLLDSRERRLAFDASWSAEEHTTFFLRSGYEQMDSMQAGSESFSSPDWWARNEDRFRTAGGGVQWRGAGDRIDLTMDYTYAQGRGRIFIDRLAQSPERLPDLKTRLSSVRADVLYHWNKRLDLGLGLRYESFRTKDWALAGVEPVTVPTLLSMGADPYSYDVSVVALSFRYFFGARELSMPDD